MVQKLLYLYRLLNLILFRQDCLVGNIAIESPGRMFGFNKKVFDFDTAFHVLDLSF
jgi:hypothetical protein